MKKLTLLLGIFALLPLFGQAQAYLSPKAGASFSNFRYGDVLNDWYDANLKFGFLFGVAVDIPVASGFSIQPEVLYVQKGSDQVSEIKAPFFDDFIEGYGQLTVYDNVDESLNYLEVPILFKYTFLGGNYGFFINAGPTVSLGLGGTLETTLVDLDDNEVIPSLAPTTYNELFEEAGWILSQDVEFGNSESDFYNAMDLGVALGGGVYFDLGSGKLNLDLRYVYGLSNMYNEGNFEQFNNSIQVALSYSIPLSTY